MKISSANAEDIFAVAMLMRQSDYDEFAGVNFVDGRRELAERLSAVYGDRIDILCVRDGTARVAIGGALELRPGALTLLFFATPDFPKIALPLTRWIKRRYLPSVTAATGAHRLEAVSACSHANARKWIKVLGLQELCVMRKFGRTGESYVMFEKVL